MGSLFGGSSQPTQSQTATQAQQAFLPGWFDVPQQNMLENSFQQAMKPYQPYQGAQVAGFTPDQTKNQKNILNQTMPATWSQAGGAYSSGLGTIGETLDRYNGFNPQETYSEALKYKPVSSNAYGVAKQYKPVASNSLKNLLGYYDFKKYNPATIRNSYNAKQYDTESFTEDGVSTKYMNPYIQEALNPSIRRIEEAGNKRALANNYAAQQAGAFGGSGHGVLGAQQQYDTLQELSDVEAEGMAAAYAAAANLHGVERDRFLRAFAENESARQMEADLGIRAQIGTEQSRQFGAGFGLDQARLRLNADQFDIGNRVQQNQFGATHRLGAYEYDTSNKVQQNQFGATHRLGAKQFDSTLGAQVAANKASIGLQGANSYFTGGAGLGALSNSYMTARSAMLSQQKQAAQQQQDLMQRLYDQRYSNYKEGRDWDKNNLSWLSQVMQSLRVPMETETAKYKTDPLQSPYDYAQYYTGQQIDPIKAAESARTPISTAATPFGNSVGNYNDFGTPKNEFTDDYFNYNSNFANGGEVEPLKGIPGVVIQNYMRR